MKLKHIALIGSLFPILFSLVLFFGVLISADSDDENSNFSSGITGMNLSAEVRVDTGNLSETCGMSNAENKCLSVGYQLTHTVRWRTSSNGTKAYPTIHTSLLLSSTGDYLNQNAHNGYA